MIDAALFARICEVADHVYIGAAPRAYERPAVVYNRLTTAPTREFDDTAKTGAATYQIDVYDQRHATAVALANVIRDHLRGYSTTGIQNVSYQSEDHMIDDTSELRLYRIRMTFFVFGEV